MITKMPSFKHVRDFLFWWGRRGPGNPSNFMHRFGYDLDAFRSVWAEGLLNFAQVFNKFYSFYEESEHGDLREHDKEETKQAVTDDMRIEKYTHQYHVLDAFSELCKQYSIAVAVRSFSALKRVKKKKTSLIYHGARKARGGSC